MFLAPGPQVHYRTRYHLEAAFVLFDPFFSELRYPQELKKLEGVSEDEELLLDGLVQVLSRFLCKV